MGKGWVQRMYVSYSGPYTWLCIHIWRYMVIYDRFMMIYSDVIAIYSIIHRLCMLYRCYVINFIEFIEFHRFYRFYTIPEIIRKSVKNVFRKKHVLAFRGRNPGFCKIPFPPNNTFIKLPPPVARILYLYNIYNIVITIYVCLYMYMYIYSIYIVINH